MFNKKVGMALLLSLALVACDGDGYGSDDGNGDTGDTDTDTGDGGTDTGDDGDSGVTGSLVLGTGSGAGFTQGELSISGADIAGGRLSAGGSAVVSVNLVDKGNANAPYEGESISVTFESQCEADGFAVFEPKSVDSSDGTVETVYTSSDCVGVDTITARYGDVSAEVDIDVAPKDVGRVGFQGFGGSSIAYDEFWLGGLPSFTAATFVLDDGFGNPVKGQIVTISLQTDIEGEGAPYLTSSTSVADANGDITAISNSEGEVTVFVHAGSVGLSVRVLATATGIDGEPIRDISSALAVNTGPVHFNGFGMRASTFAPEVFEEKDGGSTVQNATITITAFDKNNNPVADGTVVSFWAEYGLIPATCETTGGLCTVDWSSTGKLLVTSGPDHLEPDGRTTILAWTAGEDSHEDDGSLGSNGLFDVGESFSPPPLEFLPDASGGAIPMATPERFLDRDYDYQFTLGVDNYIDYDGNGIWTGGDDESTFFRGYSCSEDAKLAGHCANDVEVWDQVQIVMATSQLEVSLLQSIEPSVGLGSSILGTQTFYLSVQDEYGNQAPAGTTLSANTESGEVEILPDPVVPDEGRTSPHFFTVNFAESPDGEPESPIFIDAITPGGEKTSTSVLARVDLPIIEVDTSTLAVDGNFEVTLIMESGVNVPEYTEVTLETTYGTVLFDGGIETEIVIGEGASFVFNANFTPDGTTDPTRGFVTITATTPKGKEVEKRVLVEDY